MSLTVLRMSGHRVVRRIALAAASLSLLAPAAPAAGHHAGSAPGPVNADSTYGWGMHKWQDDFVGPRKSHWKVSHPRLVRTQHGMLTLNTPSRGTVTATLDRPGHEVGRWEIRLRSRRYDSAYANYTVRTELIPAGDRAQHCGARDIVLEGYKTSAHRANVKVRNLPNLEWTAQKREMNLGNDRWHTFAVEVTRSRITWYIDAHAFRTEKRPEALSGVPFTVRFRMAAVPGKRMNVSRMQMDWLRYHTLEKGRAPEAVPALTPGTYGKAC